jgi:hypothetical protein
MLIRQEDIKFKPSEVCVFQVYFWTFFSLVCEISVFARGTNFSYQQMFFHVKLMAYCMGLGSEALWDEVQREGELE